LNFRSLYRGIKAPLIGVGLEKAIVFGTYENMKKFSESYTDNVYQNRIVSGACSGFMASFIVTPVERFKILSQTNEKFKLKDINPRFLYKGLSATFTREMPGFAIYFSVYEGLKEHYSSKSKLNTLHYFAYGGISGGISWIFIYPQDLVKTQMQAKKKTNISFVNTVSNIYKERGVKGFFRGFRFALLRAIPLHAGTFSMVEYLRNTSAVD
jgi:hypothetical protein